MFSLLCQGVVSRGLHTKCDVLNSCTDHGKKDEISSIVSPLRDDFHITGDDDMAKVRAVFLIFPSFV